MLVTLITGGGTEIGHIANKVLVDHFPEVYQIAQIKNEYTMSQHLSNCTFSRTILDEAISTLCLLNYALSAIAEKFLRNRQLDPSITLGKVLTNINFGANVDLSVLMYNMALVHLLRFDSIDSISFSFFSPHLQNHFSTKTCCNTRSATMFYQNIVTMAIARRGSLHHQPVTNRIISFVVTHFVPSAIVTSV